MKKSTKTLIATAMVALTFGFFTLQSASDMICGNVEALTDVEVSTQKLKAFPYDSSSKVRRPYGSSNTLCNIVRASSVQNGTCLEIVVRP